MADTVVFDLVCDARADLAEGPVWDEATGQLIWVDIMACAVHHLDPVTNHHEVVDVGQPVGAVALREQGGLVLALRDGFGCLDPSGVVTMIADTEADRLDNRMNDGKCDSAGRFWAGTISPQSGEGTLYRLDPDASVTPVVSGLTLSNGLGWSPDDSTLYLIDSLERTLDAFDFDVASGTVGRPRRLVDYPAGGALPDGMTVDAEGFLWVAMYAGGSLRRYAPDGSFDRELRLPVSQPTSCTFGGADYGDLYVTTANQRKSAAELATEPTLGGIFRARPGIVGLPPAKFRG